MANPEHLEEQREETRLIIEELLEDAAIRTHCTRLSITSLQTISKPWRKWRLKRSSWATK